MQPILKASEVGYVANLMIECMRLPDRCLAKCCTNDKHNDRPAKHASTGVMLVSGVFRNAGFQAPWLEAKLAYLSGNYREFGTDYLGTLLV